MQTSLKKSAMQRFCHRVVSVLIIASTLFLPSALIAAAEDFASHGTTTSSIKQLAVADRETLFGSVQSR